MNTKSILVSILMIGVVAMGAGAGTLAYFSDVETSEDNTFTAGTLDIGLSTTFNFGDVAPGDSNTETFTITNSGTIAANSVFLELDVVDSEPTSDTEPEAAAETSNEMDISKWIEITAMTYTGSEAGQDLTSLYPDANSNTWLDLDDINTAGQTEVNGADVLSASEAATISITMLLRTDTDNKYQGDMSTVDEIVTATQD